MVRRRCPGRRSGAAAVEFAFVMNLVLIPLMIGVWEFGRLILIHQIVAQAAREGARVAAQSVTIASDGTQTKIRTAIDPPPSTPPTGWSYGNPNVKAAVFQCLHGGGLEELVWDDVTVEFAYKDQPTVTLADGSLYTASEGPTTTNPNPYTGVQGQRFTVKVGLTQDGYDKVKWTALGLVEPRPDGTPGYGEKTTRPVVSFTAEWRMMVDIPFYVNQTIPTW